MPKDSPPATPEPPSQEAPKSQDAIPPQDRFSPEEEAHLLTESLILKTSGNNLFSKSAFSDAISSYDRALATCPNYLEYELAVLNSNIAACHLKLEQWKDAVESATRAVDGLEREMPTAPSTSLAKAGVGEVVEVVEIEGDDEDDVAEGLARLELSDERRRQIEGLRAKSLLRRAKGYVGQGGWAQLAAAETGMLLIWVCLMVC